MPSKKNDLSIPWLLAPDHVSSNRDHGFLHLIAMIAMVCDHIGVVLFPRYRCLRYIGRIAMPIYAYCVATGCVYTRKPLRYLRRLVLLALITQPIYAYTMNHRVNAMFTYSFSQTPVRAVLNFCVKSWLGHPSILASLIFGMLICWSLRERQIVFAVAVAVLTWLLQNKLDYDWKATALVVLFYICCQKTWISLPCVLAFMLWWSLQGGTIPLFGLKFNIQIFSVFSLIPIYVRTQTGIHIPQWFNYTFYPLHMILIYLAKIFLL